MSNNLISSSEYKPSPQDMLRALVAIAEVVKAKTGNDPNIYIGQKRMYPPLAGQPMSNKEALQAAQALYEKKGAVTVKNSETKELYFKQTNGATPKEDNLNLLEAMQPKSVVEEVQAKLGLEYAEPFMDPAWEQMEATPSEVVVDAIAPEPQEPVTELVEPEPAPEPQETSETVPLDDSTTQLGKQIYSDLGGDLAELDQYAGETVAIAPEPVTELQEPSEELVEEPQAQEILIEPPVPENPQDPQLPPELQLESLKAEVARLTQSAAAITKELNSMKQTLQRMADRDPMAKARNWAAKQIDGAVGSLQARAKVGAVRIAKMGQGMAQKAMDHIGKTVGSFEKGLLQLDKVASDVKEAMAEIGGGKPSMEVDDYTFKQGDNGSVSVEHKDRGEIFAFNQDGPKFSGNGEDYKMFSKVGDAVKAITNPVSTALEMAKNVTEPVAKSPALRA